MPMQSNDRADWIEYVITWGAGCKARVSVPADADLSCLISAYDHDAGHMCVVSGWSVTWERVAG